MSTAIDARIEEPTPWEAIRIVWLDGSHAARYYSRVIKSFKSADTEDLFNRKRVARFVHIESVARRKLEQLNLAGRLTDLRIPPGNRLEALKGDRGDQYSIRVNDQFRVCFRWTGTDAEDVEIVDYH
jgi:proteic killer suppression protein